MFPNFVNFIFSTVAPIFALILSALLGIFLYWRTAKRELVDNQVIFDTVVLFIAGSFLGGRISDFLVRADFYGWSIKKLIFFNAFWGFDAQGGLVGGLILIFLYLRTRRDNFWDIFDYAAEGLSFGLFMFFMFLSIKASALTEKSLVANIVATAGFLLLFWVHKRLAKQKKHKGFFACFFLLTLAVINVGMIFVNWPLEITNYLWPLSFSVVVAAFAMFNWYLLARRKVIPDIKSFFGFMLLFAFKFFRTVTSIREANGVARVIILFPLFVAKAILNLVKYVAREIFLSFEDFVHAFGFKR